MYYAKFKNNQLIYKGYDGTNNYNWYISIANNLVIIRQDNNEYLIVQEGIIKDTDIYLPLQESYKNLYCPFSCATTNKLNLGGLFSIPTYSSDTQTYSQYDYQVEVYDNEFELVDTYPYILVSGSNMGNIIIVRNPTQMYSKGNMSTSSSGYLTEVPAVTKSTKTYIGSTIEFNLSDIIKKQLFGTIINNDVSVYVSRLWYVSSMYYTSSRYQNVSLKSVVVTYSNNLLYANGIATINHKSSLSSYTNIPMNFAPLGKFDKVDSIELSYLYSPYGYIYCKIINDRPDIFDLMKQNDTTYLVKGKGKNDFINFDTYSICLSLMFETGGYISEDTGEATSGSYSFTGRYYLENKNGNLTCIYQNDYTPTTKLKTPTFSNLEVQHNEESGTYALSFSANNPNSVSVNVDINISGRDGTDTITLPSGTSDWSFALAENKQGTLQGTNINALGYENADDTPKYTYYEWVEPGYLREPSLEQCYLSTTDDKNYSLNIIVVNTNSVIIPTTIHYGKNLENKYQTALQLNVGSYRIENVENVNGSVYFSFDKVEGYYPLPDSETITYTKLPLPPTPSSTGITLYKNNNNNKVVNKGYKLETYKVLNGTFRDSVNILNPVFQINNDEVPDCNYCYIADFRRYYYIDTITCVRTGLYKIECSVDVLYTYKDDILKSEQYISRQENEYNELLNDKLVTSEDYSTYYIEEAPIDILDYGGEDIESDNTYNLKTNIIITTFGGTSSL